MCCQVKSGQRFPCKLSLHMHAWLLAPNAVQREKIGNLNIPAVLEYRVKTIEQRKSAYDFSQPLLDDFLVGEASFESRPLQCETTNCKPITQSIPRF